MMATFLLLSMLVLAASGLSALLAGRRADVATAVGAGGAAIGCLLGLIPALSVLIGGRPVAFRAEWQMPYGSLSFGLDALSAVFLVAICLVSALCALYGSGYFYRMRTARSLGPGWAAFNFLIASLVAVVYARNGILFLAAWEAMALSSFFLVALEHDKADVREASWIYLVATHLGTAFLLPMLLLMAKRADGLDFDRLAQMAVPQPALATGLFVLAVVGFGAKAGFFPLHVWLPEAHPAAPSHVSAVLSGLLIKTGIYGLLRFLPLFGTPFEWQGWVFIAIGLASAVFGLLMALGQRDIKRILAYSSVENIGIIAIALGIGIVGLARANATLAAVGLAAVILHVFNHALFKSALFLGAGAVANQTHTCDLDRLGGLLKTMPVTGACFLVAALAVSGLPPGGAFVTEFLLLGAAWTGLTTALPLLAIVVAGLALVAGLSVASTARLFGIAFLGTPRTPDAEYAVETPLAIRAALVSLAVLCAVAGLLPPLVWRLVAPAVEQLITWNATDPRLALAPTASTVVAGSDAMSSLLALPVLGRLMAFYGLVAALILGLAALRRILLSNRSVASGPTWDCGYAAPTPRMQYTGTGFAQPLMHLFDRVVRTETRGEPPRGPFPGKAALDIRAADVVRTGLFGKAYAALRYGAGRLRWIQHGNLQLYVLYIALTLIALMVLKLG
jgi:formate hydrogenlyase subunit 3/multisubunit Na+/H+ antiporter MnhD subunit